MLFLALGEGEGVIVLHIVLSKYLYITVGELKIDRSEIFLETFLQTLKEICLITYCHLVLHVSSS
jgi:hypothetical protein